MNLIKKWQYPLFWLMTFAGVWCVLLWFGTASLQRQQEVQLFIPQWNVVGPMLASPGGLSAVLACFLVQSYHSALAVLAINGIVVATAALLVRLLLEAIGARRTESSILAIAAAVALLKAHISQFYVLDGTVAIVLMLAAVVAYMHCSRLWAKIIAATISLPLLYMASGQMVAIYGAAILVASVLKRDRQWYVAAAGALIAAAIVAIHIRLAVSVPITDGIYSLRYQQSQMHFESFVYYIWLRFAVVLLAAAVLAALMKLLAGRRHYDVVSPAVASLAVLALTWYCRPDAYETKSEEMDRLALLEQNDDWDAIINLVGSRATVDEASLNYLNLALACKGELADSMFHYNQISPNSLIAEWDRSYYMSVLLSNIHYRIGDLAQSEGYAMEGLTLAKRGGSPLMMQRLADIALARGEKNLADKFIGILSSMPHYRRWQPQLPDASKQFFANDSLKLTCDVKTDTLWMAHLDGKPMGRIAWQYLGCSYLLGRKLDAFAEFIRRYGNYGADGPLPIHFQEALMLIAENDPSILEVAQVSDDVKQRFATFNEVASQIFSDTPEARAMLTARFGRSYWFYCFFKRSV